jgi:hypothetical protein
MMNVISPQAETASASAAPANARSALFFVCVTRVTLSASLRLDSLRSLGSALAGP